MKLRSSTRSTKGNRFQRYLFLLPIALNLHIIIVHHDVASTLAFAIRTQDKIISTLIVVHFEGH